MNNFTNYYFYQDISIKTDKIPNFIKKVILFIISKPQIDPKNVQVPPTISDDKLLNQNKTNDNKDNDNDISKLWERINVL